MVLETRGLIGALLYGRYQVTSELGAGGMAFVYLATDREEDRQVVIKVPRPAMLEDPGLAARFLREIKSLVRLSHPHIVNIIDVGEHNGKPFVVLEYCSGGSLRDRLTHGPRPIEELQTWLPGVASALDFCHQNDCIHRDVKPDNILFDAGGKAYLSDFGIAKVIARTETTKMTVLTGAGFVLGTAQYMAPELVMGLPYDGRVDQYGLAVTVYEVLAGRTPFGGNTPMAVVVEQSTKQVPPLHMIASGVSRSLSALIARGLAKDPARRFKNCVDFADGIVAEAEKPIAALEAADTSKGMPATRMEPKSGNVPAVAAAPKKPISGAEAGPDVDDEGDADEDHAAPSTSWGASIAYGILGILCVALVPLGIYGTIKGIRHWSNKETQLTELKKDDSGKPPEPIEFVSVDAVAVKIGQVSPLRVKLRRNGFAGKITVSGSVVGNDKVFVTDSGGKISGPLSLDETQTECTLHVSALPWAEPWDGKIKIVVTGDGISKEHLASVQVARRALSVSLPTSRIELMPGQTKTLAVHLERDGYREGIEVLVANLPSEIREPKSQFIAGGNADLSVVYFPLTALSGSSPRTANPKVVAFRPGYPDVERSFTLEIVAAPAKLPTKPLIGSAEFSAYITNVGSGKIRFQKYLKGESFGKKGEKDGDEITLPASANIAVHKRAFDKESKKIVAGEKIEKGLNDDVFLTIDPQKGRLAQITVENDVVIRIMVTQPLKKKDL